MADLDLPHRIIPASSRVCPGSIFTPTVGSSRCLCGQAREWHLWANDGRGGFIDIQKEKSREQ